MSDLIIPKKLEKRLYSSNKNLADNLKAELGKFAEFLNGDKLEFFIEYTDHSIAHINNVLQNIEYLIHRSTLKKLSSEDVGIIIAAVVLHDIGMKATIELFKNMLSGAYDYGNEKMPEKKNLYNDRPWAELWDDYLKDSQFWNNEKRLNVIGDSSYIIDKDNLTKKILSLSGKLEVNEKRFIGEFIRIHHGRLAYEIAIRGYQGYNGSSISIGKDSLDDDLLQLAGIVARSHSIRLRDNYKYLIKLTDETHFKSPSNINIVFHMALIRISDYLHIDKGRTNKTIQYLRKTHSPFSYQEHTKHLAIRDIFFNDEEESVIVTVITPVKNAEIYVSIEQLISDIQSELDICWAVLGELYSDKYKLKYRRITSNLSQDGVRESQEFLPKQFGFKFNNELIKLLIAPLYGNNPSYGVRELIQNAVDACRTRMAIDQEYREEKNSTHVTVSIDSKTNLFSIVDTGIGMTIDEIEKYFLTIGSSYNSSSDWQRTREIGNIFRTGRFGIGILAAFLIGPTITIKTKSLKSNQGFQFSMSLESSFIQIDKSNDIEYGTTIEILCEKEAILALQKKVEVDISNKSRKKTYWFEWYVDTKPVVKYLFDKKPINTTNINPNITKSFKRLNHTSKNFGDVFWDYFRLFSEDYSNRIYKQFKALYVNGFLITKRSTKNLFNYDVDSFFPITIPSLYISDLNNRIPLNLQRSNIDESYEYEFERDLATAMLKDCLCQLLAISKPFSKTSDRLFFSSVGFTFNRYPFYPFSDDYLDDRNGFVQYNDICLSNKTLVHVYSHSQILDIPKWKELFDLHPNTFFSFNSFGKRPNLWRITFGRILSNSSLKKHGIAVHSSYFSAKKESMKVYKDYIIIYPNSKYRQLANDIISFVHNQFSNEANLPLFFIIHDVKNIKHKTDFDDFINDYAGGDTIVPYRDTNRKKKFKKLYEECSEDINKYIMTDKQEGEKHNRK